jgi:hypothetical protein
MWKLVFIFVVLLPLIVVCVTYVVYRAGLLRPLESRRIRELREQVEENDLLDELIDEQPRTHSRVRLRGRREL